MTEFAYKPDRKITDLIKNHEFTVSAEIIPPRNGANQNEILQQISKLKESGAQFLAVTKGAGGSLRGGSLPIAQLIKDRFEIPTIAHFTCRDLVPEEVENQLMDHHYFGIRNILGLRGDPPLNQPEWVPRAHSYHYAFQLIEQIAKLNKGEYLERQGFSVQRREGTDFCIGAAAYPDQADYNQRIGFFKRKVEAGAEFGITQMLFDVESYSRFIDELAKDNIYTPILPGTRVLRSRPQAEKMAARFQLKLPEKYLKTLPSDEKTQNLDDLIHSFRELTNAFKAAGAPGIHVFVISDTELSVQALHALQ